jgi:hypothetical protein
VSDLLNKANPIIPLFADSKLMIQSLLSGKVVDMEETMG